MNVDIDNIEAYLQLKYGFLRMNVTLKEMDARANQIARTHMGGVAIPTAILGGVCFSGYAATLVLAATDILPLWITFILISALGYISYTIVHEAVHNTINGQNKSLRWLNELLGYVCGQVTGMSLTAHRKEHLEHHRSTNKATQDPDLLLVQGGIFKVLKSVVKVPGLQLKFYLTHNWQYASSRERKILITEYTAMILWRVLFFIWAGWQAGLVLLVAAAYVSGFTTLFLFSWVVHRSFDATDRYRNTSTIIFPIPFDRVISWLWLFQNYHSIHHLFPRIPFYHYRLVFEKIEGTMNAHNAPIWRVGNTR